ncbi:MMPL family transporter [Saccharothrix violaceirubra]|uniref:RND superfamily putative drug exporter n=1 Tax=Saccharothrix violaceirubra TaxID=413306 RepID=A0A7W7WV21_9PSEU|nr:MMPL family transporter [Saccharothrix violaceirubra]MBB4964850.1 RND superfamily putative drug exporter [Saccharothrix violaceirubra]
MHASPPSRSRWLLPALIAVAWLALGGLAGPFAGKLSQVAVNDNTAFLPSSAEATEVAEQLRAIDSTRSLPAIVVAERENGLDAADRGYLTGLKLPGKASPLVPSADAKAAQIVVALDAADPAEGVEKIRAAVANPPDGLTVLVAGPAAQVADLKEAFGGIDGLLLVVAGAVVAVILVLVYRSPLLPFVVLLSGVFALALASLVVYLLADNDVLDLNGQSQGILFILVFGAATDYALLLVSRFREELRDTEDRYTAMRTAWRATIEPIGASAGTVVLGVLCLLFSDLNSNKGLGPVAAIGIGAAFVASVTFLPAVLVLLGRSAFWPLRPKLGSPHPEAGGVWAKVAGLVSRRPRLVWVVTTLVLLVGVAFVPQLKASGTAQSDVFLTDVDSVAGQELLSRHFPAGSGAPSVVLVRADRAAAVVEAAKGVPGVSSVVPPRTFGDVARVDVVLADPVDSDAALATVERLRPAVRAVSEDAKVGGPTATQLDTRNTSEHDRLVIIPIVLVVIFLVLASLLRSILAPLLLIATVVLSFGATMGVSALVFNGVFDFPGADPVVPLFGFVFLVALGIDYNIFLMTRVREEAAVRGTREGMLHGLTITGGVITSAGVVLAATFSALAVLPILFLAQIAFIVAFGVLLDTLVVRSLLVPALGVDLGRRIWWPGRVDRG